MIPIFEPFMDNSHPNRYRIQLNMENAYCNSKKKIWLFWTAEVNLNILKNEDQHITGKVQHVENKEQFMITIIYAKCKDYLMRFLWDSLLQLSEIDIPWCTMGEFNVITTLKYKLCGISYNMNKSFDFIATFKACGLMDLGYIGQNYTWCNQRE